MARDHFLMFALAGILVINIIAIVLLNNRLADRETNSSTAPPSATLGPGDVPPQAAQNNTRQVIRTQPLVRALILDIPSCPDCYDLGQYVVALNDTVNMEVERVSAQDFPFTPQRLPAMAFNKTLEEYPDLLLNWTAVGNITTVPDGRYAGVWYILPSFSPPYYITANKSVAGRVTVTYLTMRSCGECYNTTLLRTLIDSSRITVGTERTLDVETPAGGALAARYNITRVPAMVMDAQASYYPTLRPGWDVVGTVEQDGSFVLRNLQRLNVTYYDLQSRTIMRP
jgi:hypothetical protein